MNAERILQLIELLRAEEGASVTINCSNPEGTGWDNELVEVTGSWTNWQPHSFRGTTLEGALDNAVHEMKSGTHQ